VDTPEISLTTIEEMRSHLLLYFTGISRNWRLILEQQVHDTEREDPNVIDSLHHIKDIGYKIREALETGDIERFGRCLDEHWQAKKRRSGDISNARVDRCYEKAMDGGAYGGKLIGPGGDGFLMLCVPGRARHAVREEMRAEGLREMRFDWDFQGAKVLLNI
jgi:D-glycero-alpha-D-manno-heptose-7-phosphate kinase